MTAPNSGKAIGAVSRLIRYHLMKKFNNVTIGRPEATNGIFDSSNPRLNLFLYEARLDPFLKNTPVHEGMPPPIWLELKYLLTAFDEQGESDSDEAHNIVGQGIQALQTLSFLPLASSSPKCLQDNPEALKITFDASAPEIMQKLMLGSEARYRFSMAFEVRPVMISSEEPPSYSLLVGVDYTKSPAVEIGEKGIQIPILPSLGPRISVVIPQKFELDSRIVIVGENLNLPNLKVMLGSLELPIIVRRFDRIECDIESAKINGANISSGFHAISAVQSLSGGKSRPSNICVGELLPTLKSAKVVSVHHVSPPFSTENPAENVWGKIEMTGLLLGGTHDDVRVALFKDLKTVKAFSDPWVKTSTDATSPQEQLILDIDKENSISSGTYRLILCVNGMQAKNSPKVVLEAP